MTDDQTPTNSFTLTSGATLEFRGASPRGPVERLYGWRTNPVHYVVSLTGGTVSATAEVVDYDPGEWTAFFRRLAENWRGWEGDIVSSNYDRVPVKLTATHDGLGHISVRIRMSGDRHETNWIAETTIFLVAGQLDAIARDAAEYFGEPEIPYNSDTAERKGRGGEL